MVEMLCQWVSDFFYEKGFVVFGESTGLRRGGILWFWWR